MHNLKSLFIRLVRDRDGVAAVEFAVAAPMLIFGLIIMTDLGLAIQERMNLDQAVRSGAEFVMGDVSSEDDIEKLMVAAATGSYSDEPNDVENSNRPTVEAVKVCECPENPGVSVACGTTLCSNDLPASVYYHLTAKKSYDAIILPDIALSTQISIQTR